MQAKKWNKIAMIQKVSITFRPGGPEGPGGPGGPAGPSIKPVGKAFPSKVVVKPRSPFSPLSP